VTKPSGVPDRLRRHADLLLVAGIVLVALGLRLAFAFRAPPLLEFRDSASYALPALDLLRGAGFDLELKRPPAYPLFLALGFRLVGEDLPAVLVLQHLLGAATAAMTYVLVRPVAGRALGALAGLMVALNGGLIFL
jgi:4-amino-4-deoxy-L-arabinose transferase-like glycosyltransferase